MPSCPDHQEFFDKFLSEFDPRFRDNPSEYLANETSATALDAFFFAISAAREKAQLEADTAERARNFQQRQPQ